MNDNDQNQEKGPGHTREGSTSPRPFPAKPTTAERLLALSRLGTALISERDEVRRLHSIARTACDITGAAFAAFSLHPVDEEHPSVTPDRPFFQLAAVVGVTAEHEAFFRQKPLEGEGLLAPIFQHGVPVMVADALAHLAAPSPDTSPIQARISAREAARAYVHGHLPASALPSLGVPAGHPLVRSFLGAPVLDQSGEIRGGLLLGHAEPGWFTEDDQTVLVSLANQAAVALEDARLYRMAGQRAQQLDAVFEAMTEAVFVLDRKGNVTLTNQAARRHLADISPADYVTRPLAERFTQLVLADEQGQPLPPEVWPTPRLLAGEVITPERAAETSIPSRDGYTLYTHVTGAPLHDAGGDRNGAVLIVQDVTGRKRAEREREQREREKREDVEAQLELLLLILDELPISVYMVRGEEARLMLANRAATMLWGAHWPYNEPMQDFLAEHRIRLSGPIGQALSPEQWATLRAVRRGETVLQHQETIHRPDGSMLPALVNAVSLGTTSRLSRLPALLAGSALGNSEPLALVVHQDVAVFKETEHLKDEFIAIAAHELRNPVAALAGFAQMLVSYTKRGEGPQLSELQNEAIAEMELASARLITLTEELLDVTRLQAGRLVLDTAMTDLIALARGTVARLQLTTERCTLNLQVSAPALMVFVDPVRIDQVLSNLLTNAIKYTPQGGPIEVRVEEHQEQQEVLLSVRDPGMGIPEDEQAQIFGRFKRARNAQEAGLIGTGLGLYLCRELLALHGGHIWFESVEEEGSTFFLTLPLGG